MANTKTIEDEDFKSYSERLRQLTKDTSRITDKSDKSLYEVAKILVEAQQKFGENRKKLFVKLKKETTEDLGSSSRNLNKAVKVASDKRIQKHSDRLPTAFSTLYSLTSLDDEQFDKLLEDENVSSKITRDVLSDKVNQIKGKKDKVSEAEKVNQLLKKIPEKYLMIKLGDGIELTDDVSKELQDALEMTKWSVVTNN